MMGTTTAWTRGDRGWGSGPGLAQNSTITNFQQHPPALYPGDNLQTQLDEAAADMFLNWVYRSTNVGGFKNISWLGNCATSTGCDDPSLPGDARFEWVDEKMDTIFTRNW